MFNFTPECNGTAGLLVYRNHLPFLLKTDCYEINNHYCENPPTRPRLAQHNEDVFSQAFVMPL